MSAAEAETAPPRGDTEPPSSSLRLAFRPTTTLITSTRRFADDMLGTVLSDPDSTSRITLTIHELLENTLKYSLDGQALLQVLVENGENGRRRVEITAKNRATPEQARDLGRRIHALSVAEDPMELYADLMRESVKSTGSGLGLARIRVEGEMQLSCSLEGDSVIVSARTAAE